MDGFAEPPFHPVHVHPRQLILTMNFTSALASAASQAQPSAAGGQHDPNQPPADYQRITLPAFGDQVAFYESPLGLYSYFPSQSSSSSSASAPSPFPVPLAFLDKVDQYRKFLVQSFPSGWRSAVKPEPASQSQMPSQSLGPSQQTSSSSSASSSLWSCALVAMSSVSPTEKLLLALARSIPVVEPSFLGAWRRSCLRGEAAADISLETGTALLSSSTTAAAAAGNHDQPAHAQSQNAAAASGGNIGPMCWPDFAAYVVIMIRLIFIFLACFSIIHSTEVIFDSFFLIDSHRPPVAESSQAMNMNLDHRQARADMLQQRCFVFASRSQV
jgi:hypothetical protein